MGHGVVVVKAQKELLQVVLCYSRPLPITACDFVYVKTAV